MALRGQMASRRVGYLPVSGATEAQLASGYVACAVRECSFAGPLARGRLFDLDGVSPPKRARRFVPLAEAHVYRTDNSARRAAREMINWNLRREVAGHGCQPERDGMRHEDLFKVMNMAEATAVVLAGHRVAL
mgnify:CR=1 FL=1